LRDKYRMQHCGEGLATGDNMAGDRGSDAAARKQGPDDVSSSGAAERVSVEQIQVLDRSPQHGAMVRGRRESGGPATAAVETTSPSRVSAAVDDSIRSMDRGHRSPEKKLHVPTSLRSPVQATSDGDVVTAHDVSVTSRAGEAKPKPTGLAQEVAGRRPSGHVSDGAYRQDRRSRAHRTGYVSDTSFSAVVRSAADDSVLSTATEGA